MALGDKPASLPEWASDGTEIIEPSAGVKAVGWKRSVNAPSPQVFNWWQNLLYLWVAWLTRTQGALYLFRGAFGWDSSAWTSVSYVEPLVVLNHTTWVANVADQRFEFEVANTSGLLGVALVNVTDQDLGASDTGPYWAEAVYKASEGKVYVWVYREDGSNVMDSPQWPTPLDAFLLQLVVF